MEGELLSIICNLLISGKIWFSILTDNDYFKVTRKTVVLPLPKEIRRNLIVYADSCTRKLTYGNNGEEIADHNYHNKIKFTEKDKKIIKNLLFSIIEDWGGKYPELYKPNIEVYKSEVSNVIEIIVGPINTNEPNLEIKRNKFQEILKKELEQDFVEVQLIIFENLWIKFHCKDRISCTLSDISGISILIKEILDREEFMNFSKPSIIDRGQQIAIKPIKPLKTCQVNEKENNSSIGIRGILIKEIEEYIDASAKLHN